LVSGGWLGRKHRPHRIDTKNSTRFVSAPRELGNEYVVGIHAVGCSSGDTLAKEQEEAASKEEVLKALSKAASLRGKLGESLASVQKFDVPIEATTISLEAPKAYSMGITTGSTRRFRF
jgi:eukaryotic-like serine/threonine-protein kinase